MYQKNRDADGFDGFGGGKSGDISRTTSGTGNNRTLGAGVISGNASAGGSGTHTPHSQPVRRGGAVTITEAKPRQQSNGERASQKGKQREEKIWDLPKSKTVKRLEKLVEDLKTLQAGGKVPRKDTEVECFCQGEFWLSLHFKNLSRSK